jgi:hypothetical protein
VSRHPISMLSHAHRDGLDYRTKPAAFALHKLGTSVVLVCQYHTKRNYLNSGRTSPTP